MHAFEKSILPLRPVTVTSSLREQLEKRAVRSGISINELCVRYAAAVVALRDNNLLGIFETGDLADNQAIAPITLPTSAP
jgi:hypothetical protein